MIERVPYVLFGSRVEASCPGRAGLPAGVFSFFFYCFFVLFVIHCFFFVLFLRSGVAGIASLFRRCRNPLRSPFSVLRESELGLLLGGNLFRFPFSVSQI